MTIRSLAVGLLVAAGLAASPERKTSLMARGSVPCASPSHSDCQPLSPR